MPGIADKFTQSAQGRLLRAGHDEREIFSLASEMLANEFVAAD
jgi:hypothetical protein